ncbi:Uncharacterised protein [Mycolicibacterium fortuitum]|uniref:Uncharacterized protein n=1 Tax=Mycolicibacterium fortuitum TaxID=1766 RepID=A0A378U9X9_MYCFO|nr:Uncharacterised protein [Mycolicibacterium fortuitum]
MNITRIIAGAAVACGLAAGTAGLSAATASAAPIPGQPMAMTIPGGPNPAPPPAWAPPTPAPPTWGAGNPQVWDQGWQHWGVWMNGVFVPTF